MHIKQFNGNTTSYIIIIIILYIITHNKTFSSLIKCTNVFLLHICSFEYFINNYILVNVLLYTPLYMYISYINLHIHMYTVYIY
jgi:hypothetical protein